MAMVEFQNQFLDSIKRLASEEFVSPNYIVPTLEKTPDSLLQQSSAASLDTAHDALSVFIEKMSFITEAPSMVANAVASGFVGTPMPIRPSDNPLLVMFLLLAFFSFMYIVISRRLYVNELLKSFFILKERLSIFVDSTSKSLSFFNINLLYLLVASTSVIIYVLACYYGFEPLLGFGGATPLICILLPVGFLSMKACGLHFLNFIFKGGDLYIRSYFFLLYALGIVLFPVAVLLVFAPSYMFESLLIVSGVFLAVYVSLLIYKIFQIFFMGNLSSLLYIILYLCTFEIVALLISLKLMMAW